MRVAICCIKNYAEIVVCVVFAVFVVAYCTCAPFAVRAVIAVSRAQTTKTIAIDAGHGGADGGVKGVKTSVEEKTLNLIIANYLGEMLKGCGYNVVQTRKNDTMYTFDGVSNNNKRADMYKRGEIVNGCGAVALVSVHINFYSMPTRRGAQVFYSKSNDKSKQFAKIAQDLLNENINLKEGGRAYSALCTKKYLLDCAPIPSIIVECGFLSNIVDEQLLLQPAYQQRLAYWICQAVCTYFA